MKKLWFVLLVLLVVGTAGAQVWTTNAPANYKVKLAKNEWGPGYQVQVQPAWLFNGQQMKVGEKYELEITFKPSRALNQLQVMLVDTTPKANYWTETSDDKPVIEQNMAANADFSLTLPFTIHRGASDASAKANSIVFDTQHGTATVELTFSKFTLKRIQ